MSTLGHLGPSHKRKHQKTLIELYATPGSGDRGLVMVDPAIAHLNIDKSPTIIVAPSVVQGTGVSQRVGNYADLHTFQARFLILPDVLTEAAIGSISIWLIKTPIRGNTVDINTFYPSDDPMEFPLQVALNAHELLWEQDLLIIGNPYEPPEVAGNSGYMGNWITVNLDLRGHSLVWSGPTAIADMFNGFICVVFRGEGIVPFTGISCDYLFRTTFYQK